MFPSYGAGCRRSLIYFLCLYLDKLRLTPAPFKCWFILSFIWYDMHDTHWFLNELRGRRRWDGCLLRPGDEAAVPSGKVCTRTSLSFCLCSPAFPPSPLLSSLDAACVFLSTEGSSAWIIRLRCYWCIKLRVWFLSRPCHQSQFARALAECNISLIGSTRKLRSWTVLIREEIIKLGAPGKITLWALL